MRRALLDATALAASVCVVACAGPSTMSTDTTEPHNALLAEWTGPHGGVPAFHRMDLGALTPALEAGMTRQLDEIDAIASNPEPPTFENTLVALERAGRDLDRVSTYLGVWSSNLSTPEFREIQREMAP
jgi:peptidyl-dipeptidase Dcp